MRILNDLDPLKMNLFGDDDFDSSVDEENLSIEALKKILGETPDALELQEYKPDQYKSAGTYKPQQVTTQNVEYEDLGPSEMENVSTDPRLQGAQMDALLSLQDIGKGGLTAQDKADLARIESGANQQDRGRREAILMNNQARGMGGSGQELLAQLASSQAATDRQYQQGLDVEGMAQQRALAALSQAGQLGGNMRGQEFDEKSKRAAAMDSISRFNSANTLQNNQFGASQNLQGQQFNAGAGNESARFGLQNQQSTNDKNTSSGNEAKRINQFDIPLAQHKSKMDIYGRQVDGAGRIADIASGRSAGEAAGSAERNKAVLAGAGTGAATGAGIGAMAGGIGAVPGAAIGGLVGGGAAYFATKKPSRRR